MCSRLAACLSVALLLLQPAAGVAGTAGALSRRPSSAPRKSLRATDKQGVSRIDLTQEYVRAVETFSLAYADLKEIVRNSLEYSFLPGPSLWGESGSYARVVEACRTDAPGADKPSQPCAAFLDGSEKATQ